jgi:NAD(P)-dependent dehydrogenase (short-subunit alcohol dehydrogenase family)
MKKIAITGHTQGIGKAVVDLCKHDYEILGFSRATGHNLLKPGVVERIFEEAKDCDIFINNAFSTDAQMKLFDLFYNYWKDDVTKFIINVNSKNRFRAGDGSFGDNGYAAVKALLHKQWIDVLHESGRLCKISNISPGFVDTYLISHFSVPEWLKQPPEECAETIMWLINQPDNVEIGEVSYWRRKAQ